MTPLRPHGRCGFRPILVLLAVLVVGCQEPTQESAQLQSASAGEVLAVQNGVVASTNRWASQVGAEALADGGNAVDAAIAVGFALAVTNPSAGNIGGGGFMVVRTPEGETTTFDFREKAPLASHPEMFYDEDGEFSREIRHRSHVSVGVPGTVAGFELAHQRLGRMEWARLVEPSVGLAREGIELTPSLAGSIAGAVSRMEERGYEASVQAFSRAGVPYEAGELWQQHDLARTLERIRDEGRDGFYLGETADLLVAEMERGGGLITHEDLELYEAVERAPVRGTFLGYEVIGMGPPSSGGTAIVQMLNVLEGFDLEAMGHNSPAYVHHVAEAMRFAFRDRAAHLADMDFADVPLERLTSREYAEELRAQLDPDRAGESSVSDIQPTVEAEETTHYSVVDADGMAVSVTYTLEGGYGSHITVPDAGFLLNNEMGDFNAGPGITDEGGLIGTEPNLARPEQRMLSSMSPTILAREGELVAVIGSPGGRTIINTVLQLVLNRTAFQMDPLDMLSAPRFHHQWLPDRITAEETMADPELISRLEAMGHTVETRGRQGAAHSIVIEMATGTRIGVPDPRIADGTAAGY
jgi:gamma-glutamyltranspeptidase / glutathione hydrolase